MHTVWLHWRTFLFLYREYSTIFSFLFFLFLVMQNCVFVWNKLRFAITDITWRYVCAIHRTLSVSICSLSLFLFLRHREKSSVYDKREKSEKKRERERKKREGDNMYINTSATSFVSFVTSSFTIWWYSFFSFLPLYIDSFNVKQKSTTTTVIHRVNVK